MYGREVVARVSLPVARVPEAATVDADATAVSVPAAVVSVASAVGRARSGMWGRVKKRTEERRTCGVRALCGNTPEDEGEGEERELGVGELHSGWITARGRGGVVGKRTSGRAAEQSGRGTVV